MEAISTPHIKAAETEHHIHPLICKRWSPRSFSDRAIEEAQMNELLEAARWSASANNEQPWQYVYAHRGTPGFDQLWNCLLPGNQPWAQNAAVLVVAIQRNTFASSGKTNPWAMHDLGMANAQLMLQATSQDIYGHMMAGFDAAKTKAALQLTDDQKPVCIIALGYLGEAEALEEPYLSRELSPRNRRSVTEFATKL